jgi:hypothetical protein
VFVALRIKGTDIHVAYMDNIFYSKCAEPGLTIPRAEAAQYEDATLSKLLTETISTM